MQRSARILLNVVFFLQVLLLFLFLFEDRLSLPAWLQVAGRMHPVMLHLPIGAFAISVVLVLLESQFRRKAFRKVVLVALLITSVTASMAALMGILLAHQGDYGQEALSLHRNSGIILSFLSYFLLASFFYTRELNIVGYGLGLITAGTLVFAGHTGSVLTHGENYLLAPLNKSETNAAENVSAFSQVIYPVLEKKCTSCHNKAKAKGKFVMTSMSEFLKGGKHGLEWVAGKPAESRMIQYIHLPMSDDDHMPPDGKPQLTKQEITLLELWIAAGADVEKPLAEFPAADSFKILGLEALAMTKIASSQEPMFEFSSASEETILKMNSPFRAVFPLYQGSPALQADFFIRESFQSKSLEELREVKDQLVVVNLNKMPVTDQDLAVLADFTNLEKLNLNFSKIEGSGLSSLTRLKKLSSLSVAGTGVRAQSLAPIMAMPSLRELYIWNTKVTEQEKATLTARNPRLSIFTTQFKDDETLRLSKPILVNEGVLKKGEQVVLRHSMPGVVIRYTLDGTSPDSVTSRTFEEPIALASTSVLKAIACRPGWYCSEKLEITCFVEGIKPTRAHLLAPADKQYLGEGDISLVDNKKGFIESFKEPAWLGFQNNPFVAAFEFGPEAPVVNSIVLSYGKNVGSHIMPPEVVEVWAGQSGRDARLIQTVKIAQPVGYDPQQLAALVITLKPARYSYYKVVAKPVAKLPSWHSGKGKKGWVFVDEVFFY